MFVYAIRMIRPPTLIKIGVSGNPIHRVKQLQTGCAFDLQLCHAAWLGGEASARRLEKELHKELHAHRLVAGGSEWFGASALKFLRRRALSEDGRFEYPACAEFYDKRLKGGPLEVQEQVKRLLSR